MNCPYKALASGSHGHFAGDSHYLKLDFAIL